MAVVSSTVQLLSAAKGLMTKTQEASSHWHRLMTCSKAVADAIKLLSSSIRAHTPVLSRKSAEHNKL